MPYFLFPLNPLQCEDSLLGFVGGFRMTPPGGVTLMALIIQCHHASALIWLGLLRSCCDLAEIPAFLNESHRLANQVYLISFVRGVKIGGVLW